MVVHNKGFNFSIFQTTGNLFYFVYWLIKLMTKL